MPGVCRRSPAGRRAFRAAGSPAGNEGRPVFRFEVTVDGGQREITVDRVNGEVVTNEVIG